MYVSFSSARCIDSLLSTNKSHISKKIIFKKSSIPVNLWRLLEGILGVDRYVKFG